MNHRLQANVSVPSITALLNSTLDIALPVPSSPAPLVSFYSPLRLNGSQTTLRAIEVSPAPVECLVTFWNSTEAHGALSHVMPFTALDWLGWFVASVVVHRKVKRTIALPEAVVTQP